MTEFSELLFQHDQLSLSESNTKLNQLKPGVALVISHSATFFNVDGIIISVDVGSLQVKPLLTDRNFLVSPSLHDSYNISRPEYPIKLFPDSSTAEVGKALGSKVLANLVSHADTDHFDAKMAKAMAEANQNQVVYLPPEIIAKIKSDNTNLPENFLERLHSNNDLDKIILKGKSGNVTITLYSVSHQGDPRIVKSVYGFIIEGNNQKILYVPDSGFSPEIVKKIINFQQEKPFTQLFVSTTKFQPDNIYGFFSNETSKKFRENFEEQVAHSTIIGLALAEITGLTANIIHQNFYHKSNRNADLTYRIPATTDLPNSTAFTGDKSNYEDQWHDLFMDKIMRAELRVDTRINDLNEKLDRLPGSQSLASSDMRFRFARHVRRWLNLFPVPKSHLDKLHMVQPNEIIHAN